MSGTPVLLAIAGCESGLKQFDGRGDVIRGRENKNDVGILQINEYYHAENAKDLGFDLYTLDGNLGYAKWLYGKYGTSPWSSSKYCWQKIDGGN